MVTHGVARMTARQALSVLRDEGVAEARQGAGVFVRAFRPLRLRGIQRLAQQQWGSGRSIWSADIENRALEVDQVSVSEGAAPDHVSAVLDLADEDTVCVRRLEYDFGAWPALLQVSPPPNPNTIEPGRAERAWVDGVRDGSWGEEWRRGGSMGEESARIRFTPGYTAPVPSQG